MQILLIFIARLAYTRALSTCNTKQEVAPALYFITEQRTRTVDDHVLFIAISVTKKEDVEKEKENSV